MVFSELALAIIWVEKNYTLFLLNCSQYEQLQKT